MEASYRIWSDNKKNRLYVVLKGAMSDGLAKEMADHTIEEAKKLTPGFTVINDISELEPITEIGAKEIKRAQAFLGYKGVKRIIRVVSPAMDLARKQFEAAPQGYPAANTASSIEEAEKMLG